MDTVYIKGTAICIEKCMHEMIVDTLIDKRGFEGQGERPRRRAMRTEG